MPFFWKVGEKSSERKLGNGEFSGYKDILKRICIRRVFLDCYHSFIHSFKVKLLSALHVLGSRNTDVNKTDFLETTSLLTYVLKLFLLPKNLHYFGDSCGEKVRNKTRK